LAGTGQRGRARIGPVEADLAGTGRRGEVLVLGFGLGYAMLKCWAGLGLLELAFELNLIGANQIKLHTIHTKTFKPNLNQGRFIKYPKLQILTLTNYPYICFSFNL